MVSVKCVTGGAEHVFDLVADEVLDGGAGRAEVFARIKLLGILPEHFSNGSSHSQSEIRVDVHLGTADTSRNFYIGLRHTRSVVAELAAKFIDFLDEIFWTLEAPWRTSG